MSATTARIAGMEILVRIQVTIITAQTAHEFPASRHGEMAITKNLHIPQPATVARKRSLVKSGQARARMRNLDKPAKPKGETK